MTRYIRTPSQQMNEYIQANFLYNPITGELFRVARDRQGATLMDTVAPNGYYRAEIKHKGDHYYPHVHRICWFLYYGYWPQDELDHINQNKKDNRITNLRLATSSKNKANMQKPTQTKRIVTSKYKGVSCEDGRWRVRLEKKGMQPYRVTRYTEEDAARAYDEKAIEWFGEFACLNFPKDTE